MKKIVALMFVVCAGLSAFAGDCGAGNAALCADFCGDGGSVCDRSFHFICVWHNRSYVSCGDREVISCTCYYPSTGYENTTDGNQVLVYCDNGVTVDENGEAFCTPEGE